MARRWVTVGLVACLAVLLASSAVPAQDGFAMPAQDGTVAGRPNLRLAIPDPQVESGEVATLSLLLVNDARIFRGGDPRDETAVTTAYNVSVRPRTERLGGRLADALEFHTGRVPVGVVPPGVTGPVEFRVAVGESLPPGRYRIPFAVTYTYTAFVQPNESVLRIRTRTETLTATVAVEASPQLRLSTAPNQSLTRGESRVVNFTVTNVGSEAAREVGLTLSTDNGSVYFGTRLDRQSKVSVYVPELAPDETRTVGVRMGADDATPAGTYLVAGRATYRDEFGSVHEAEWLAAGVVVRERAAD